MGLDITEENIQKKLAKRRERVKVAQEINKDTYFYYLREENRQIFGGACLKKVDGVWCRGISLCSNKDRFDKNAARGQAISRLMTAVATKANGFAVHPSIHQSTQKLFKNYNFVNKIGFQEFCYKSRYNAELTNMEKRTVGE